MTYPASLIDHADGAAFDADQRAVWHEQKSMYAGFLTGDRSRTDAHMDDAITVWDVDVDAMAVGLTEYNALRAARPSDATLPRVLTIECCQPIIDVWGDTAAGRHVLRVTYVDGSAPTETLRVSAVWRRRQGAWYLVHSHEDRYAVEA